MGGRHAERIAQARKRLLNDTDRQTAVSHHQWMELRRGLDLIFAPDLLESMSMCEYMTLFNKVHDYVTRPTPPGAVSAALELYDRIESFLNTHLANQARRRPFSSDEDDQLHYYVSTFDNYLHSATVMRGVFSGINRQFILLSNVPNDMNQRPDKVYHLALRCWKNTIFQLLSDSVSHSILCLICKSRAGEKINSQLISTVVNSYTQLGVLDSDDVLTQNLSIYVQYFENKFLEDAEKFYDFQSKSFLQNNPCVVDFMCQIEKWLQEEANRVKIALHKTTLPKIVRICENTLIQPHLELFYSNFGPLLAENKVEDLRRLYNLVSRLSREYILQMSISFEEKLLEVGREIVGAIPNKEDINAYFETLFQFHGQFQTLVTVSFQSNVHFRAALDRGCISLVNANSVATNPGLAAVMLAKFWDRVMKTNMIDHDIEMLMDKIIVIMKFLTEKDAFQIHYCMFLGNRLTRDTCMHPDFESLFVSKLEHTQGTDYTSRMKRMLADVTTSEGLSMRFQKDCRTSVEPLPCVFCVQILTSGTWRYTQDSVQFTCPQWLGHTCTRFVVFYNNIHRARELKWLNGCSHGELKYCPPNSKATYTFKVSTYQMAILLMFNDADVIQIRTILETTTLPFDILIQVLEILLKYRILEKTCKDEELTPDSFVNLFMTYNNKSKKPIRINFPLKSESKEQDDRLSDEVKNTRKVMLQAAIVRIMKTAKTKTHKLLVCDVIDDVKEKFMPNVKDIRQCIEDMLDQSYIKRSETDNDVYIYLA